MTETQGGAADGVPGLLRPSLPDGEDGGAFSVELTGRAPAPTAHGDAPLTPEASRDVLAGVLGLATSSLACVSALDAERALQRLQGLMRRLAEAAGTDDLTGAMRRGVGVQALQREVARARRGQNRLVLAVLDVDNLKQVNDTEGHLAGDRLLREVVGSLRSQLRPYDLVIRYGGDEFLCVFSEVDLPGARARFRRVAVELARRTNGRTLSIGLAALRKQDTVERLIGRADAALYAGRGRRRAGANGAGPHPA